MLYEFFATAPDRTHRANTGMGATKRAYLNSPGLAKPVPGSHTTAWFYSGRYIPNGAELTVWTAHEPR